MKNGKTTIRIIVLVVLVNIVETFADLAMKKGLINTGINSVGIHNLIEFILRNASSLFIWVGVLLYLVAFILWITVLHQVDLSVAFPISSLDYVIVPFAAIIFLGEHVPFIRWMGIASIIIGICVVSIRNQNGAAK